MLRSMPVRGRWRERSIVLRSIDRRIASRSWSGSAGHGWAPSLGFGSRPGEAAGEVGLPGEFGRMAEDPVVAVGDGGLDLGMRADGPLGVGERSAASVELAGRAGSFVVAGAPGPLLGFDAVPGLGRWRVWSGRRNRRRSGRARDGPGCGESLVGAGDRRRRPGRPEPVGGHHAAGSGGRSGAAAGGGAPGAGRGPLRRRCGPGPAPGGAAAWPAPRRGRVRYGGPRWPRPPPRSGA